MLPAVWMKFRGELRVRWAAWLGLALLIGIVLGGVMVAAAGARRTASAHQRFRTDLASYDVLANVLCRKAPMKGHAERCHRAVDRLPTVADSASVSTYDAFVATKDGRSLQPDANDPCYSGPGEVIVAGDRAGRFGTELNRIRITAGRRPDPARADEVVLTAATADRLALHPGSRLRIAMFDGEDCGADPSTWRAPMEVRVVGIGIAPGEIPPASGLYLAFVHVTPAFVAREPVGDESALAVRFRTGASVRDFRQQVRRSEMSAYVIVDLDDYSESVERSIRPQATALGLFAALAALAGAVVLGQLLARQTRADSTDHAVLSALGMGRGARTALGLVRAGFIGTVAAAVGVTGAVLASPIAPIGLARTLEPQRGVAVDATVLGGGAALIVGLTLLVGGVVSWVITRRPVSGDARVRVRRSWVAGSLGRAGAPASVSSGVRMALERATGRRSAPIASSIVAIALALFTVTAALTFGAGLDHLLRTPRLTGWNWDVVWGPDDGGRPVGAARLAAALRAEPRVEAFAAGTFFSPFPHGRQLQLGRTGRGVAMFSFDGGSSIGPAVISGRAPRTDRELLVGSETLEDLALDVGDRVVAHGQAGSWEEPGSETEATFTIVGTGTLPFTDRLGRGASMTLAGVARLNPDRGSDGVFLRLTPGSDARSVIGAVARRLDLPVPTGEFFIDTHGRKNFAELRDLENVDRAPLLFAALMALMAAGVLVNVLVSAARARRRDLAVLRVLGFGHRRVRATVASMSSTYVVLAVVVSVPGGIVAGRLAWLTFADHLHVVPEAPVPWALVALVIGAAMLVALVVAIPIARRMSARSTARELAPE